MTHGSDISSVAAMIGVAAFFMPPTRISPASFFPPRMTNLEGVAVLTAATALTGAGDPIVRPAYRSSALKASVPPMTTRTRKIIALFFIAMFAASAPAVILYTAGYRYHWKKGKFEKTGIIVVDSVPSAADILINGDRQRQRTPASITRLLPDDYAVRVEKPGAMPWQKTLAVRSGETSFASDIVLFKEALPRQVAKIPIKTAAFAVDGRVAAVTAGDDVMELAVSDVSGRSTLLARFAADREGMSIVWSPDGSRLAFSSARRGADDAVPELFLYDAGGDAPVAVHELLGDAAGDEPTRLAGRWSDDGTFLAVSSSGVYEVDPVARSARPIITSPHILDALSGAAVYTLRSERTRVADKGAARTTIVLEASDPNGDAPRRTIAVLPDGDYRLLDTVGGRIAVADLRAARTTLIDFRDGEAGETFPSVTALRRGPGGRILLWSDFEMTVFDPKTGSRTLVTRQGTPINDAFWHPSGAYVVSATDSGITATELDDRGQKNSYDLGRFSRIDALHVDPSGSRILVAGAIGGQEGVFERDL
jgi:hypothetical protein